jgi:phosphomannomutase/phosphoglucomutase
LQLRDVHRRSTRETLFFDEGIAGTYLDDLVPGDVRQLAVAHGIFLRGQQRAELDFPLVVIASDGRPLTAELLAAVSDGLRFAGCKVVDIGHATAPCVVFAMDHLDAVGGLYVGNALGGSQEVSLKFWGEQAEPLSASGALDELQAIAAAPLNRPLRRHGPLRRFRAEVPYLACLHKYFHALRPLRIVISTSNSQLLTYLQHLCATVACELIPIARSTTGERAWESLAEKVTSTKAHAGLWMDGDGEACRLVDERGRAVETETTLRLLVQFLSDEHPRPAVAVADTCTAAGENALRQIGATVHRCGGSRQQMHRALAECQGLVGADREGRIWFHDHRPSADALKTLAVLLNVLSQGDQDLSQLAAAAQVVR